MSVLNRSAIKDTRSKIKPVIRWRNVRDALPFLLPALFFFCTFILYPLFNVFRLSLMEWNGFVTTQPIYVGFENYVTIFTEDPVFWTATGNSLKWMFLSLTIPTTIGLGIALSLESANFRAGCFPNDLLPASSTRTHCSSDHVALDV